MFATDTLRQYRNCFPTTTTTPTTPTTPSKFSWQLHRAIAPKPLKLIMKCHTILEMGSQDLSPHTFVTGPPFWKGAQKGFF